MKKLCSKCGKNPRIVYSSGKVFEWCKECNREKNKKYYQKNREKAIAYSYKWQRDNPEKSKQHKKTANLKLRKEALRQYGGNNPKCKCCGENKYEFLAIDHIDGGGKKHRKEVGCSNIYSWLKKNNYPKGFRVLCHNCNSALGFYGYCPHNNLK